MTDIVPAELTPETLTYQDILKWSAPEMKQKSRLPEWSDAINQVLLRQSEQLVEATAAQAEGIVVPVEDAPAEVPPVPTAEEVAAAAEATRVAAEAEVARVAAEAEAARVAAEAVKPKKIVVDYQVKDEDGNPIGRPTHLEATSEEEMRLKLIEAHTQATRWGDRLKKQKISTLKEQQPVTPPATGMSDEELLAAMADIKSGDQAKALEAQRRITKAEVDRQLADERAKKAEFDRQLKASQEFLANHRHDYNPCDANTGIMQAYFRDNKLPWTLGNLEIAFEDLQSKFAPVVKQTPVEAPAIPAAPEVVVPTAPAAQPVVQPVVAAPAPVVAPAIPAPAAPRPGVNGGIMPGQNSGSRPPVKPAGLTMAQINAWDAKTMRVNMRNPQLRPQIEAAIAAHNAALASRKA